MKYLSLLLLLLPVAGLSADDAEIRARIALELALLNYKAPKQTKEPPVILEGWPVEVPLIPRMKWFRKTRYNQYLAINNSADFRTMFRLDQDQHFTNSAPFMNPNNQFPWVVSGGLHESTGWKSRGAVALPEGGKVTVWQAPQEIGASRRQWKVRWAWPVGTTFADVLSTDKGVFEVRTLTKGKDGWEPDVAYKDMTKAPANYTGPRKNCVTCHSGEGYNGNYGPQLRLEDFIFSASPLKEGTDQLDHKAWPIEQWQPQSSLQGGETFRTPQARGEAQTGSFVRSTAFSRTVQC